MRGLGIIKGRIDPAEFGAPEDYLMHKKPEVWKLKDLEDLSYSDEPENTMFCF
jgi:hypothetical protein